MFEFPRIYVGQRFLHRGRIGKVIWETDSGAIGILVDGVVIPTSFQHLHPIDGITAGFRILDLPAPVLALAA